MWFRAYYSVLYDLPFGKWKENTPKDVHDRIIFSGQEVVHYSINEV